MPRGSSRKRTVAPSRSPDARSRRAQARRFDAAIDCTTFIRAEPRRVYDALATGRGLDGWFTAGAEFDARPGGRVLFRWRDWGPDHVTTEAAGEVLEARAGRRLVFRWDSGNPEWTTVTVDLEAREGGTVVRLRETGYPDTAAGHRRFADCASGWGEALTLVKFHLEHGLRY
jgi:uncharacterized protein YndB with AHSA1/START domain